MCIRDSVNSRLSIDEFNKRLSSMEQSAELRNLADFAIDNDNYGLASQPSSPKFLGSS